MYSEEVEVVGRLRERQREFGEVVENRERNERWTVPLGHATHSSVLRGYSGSSVPKNGILDQRVVKMRYFGHFLIVKSIIYISNIMVFKTLKFIIYVNFSKILSSYNFFHIIITSTFVRKIRKKNFSFWRIGVSNNNYKSKMYFVYLSFTQNTTCNVLV